MTNLPATTDPQAIVQDGPAPSALAALGKMANGAAAEAAIVEHLSLSAENTIRGHAAGLRLFAQYLDHLREQVAARPRVNPERLAELAEQVGAMRQFADDVGTWPHGAQIRPDLSAWAGVTWGIVKGFAEWLLNAGYAIGTVNNRIANVRVYADQATIAGELEPAEMGLIERNVKGWHGKKAKRKDERRDQTRVGSKKAEHVSLSLSQAEKLKDHDTDSPQGRRDRLLMCLLLDHGLRVSEVAGLVVKGSVKVDDTTHELGFDLDEGRFTFYRPKVHNVGNHRMTADTARAAKAYFEHDAPALGGAILGSVKGGELNGRPMSRRAITKRVRYLGQQRLGIDNLSAHDCRHYCATDMARREYSVDKLMAWFGWTNAQTAMRYIEAEEVQTRHKG